MAGLIRQLGQQQATGDHRFHEIFRKTQHALGVVNLSCTHTVWQSCGMNTVAPAIRYKNHRFPTGFCQELAQLAFERESI